MFSTKMTNKEVTCKRCGSSWTPRKKVSEIVICPRCRSPYWNKPKRGEY